MDSIVRKGLLTNSALIFLVTFVIRLLFILETMDIPAFRTPNPGMDIALHWQAAQLILEGATTDEPYFEIMMPSTPLHQYWLAFWQLLLGEQMLLFRLFHAVLGSITAVLVFWLVDTLVKSRPISYLCAFIWAALPSLIYFDSTLHKSVLEILALIVLIYTVLDKFKTRYKIYFPLKGLVIGVLLMSLLLLQGSTFLYCIIIFVYVTLDKQCTKKARIRTLIPAIIIFLGTFSVYQYRTEIWDSKYPWFLPQKGIHFRIGFHEGASGAYHQLKGIKPWPYGHVFHSRLYAEARDKKANDPQGS